MYSQKNRALRAAPVVSKPDEVQKHMSAQLHCGVGENVGSMGAKLFFVRSERKFAQTNLANALISKNRVMLLSCSFEFVLLAVVLNRVGWCP